MIRPSDCDLKYHFGPKVLENVRKNLFILRFLQLVFVMTSPLINEHFTTSINLNSVKCAARKVGFPGSCACAYSMGAKVPYPRFMRMRI